MKTIIAFGTFDVLHPGHVHYLERAKALGGRLVVVVARDESVRMLKNREPVFGQAARLKMVGSLKVVDMAVLGNRLRKEGSMYEIFRRHRPDIIALGYDQKVCIPALREWLARNGINAMVIKLRVRLNDDIYKSSKLIKRMALKRKTRHSAREKSRKDAIRKL